jgi:hypothetical protein
MNLRCAAIRVSDFRTSDFPMDGGWWALRDSNPRPTRCKRDALTAAPSALPGQKLGESGAFDNVERR